MEEQIVMCAECAHPYEESKGRCPAPHCFDGFAAWAAARREWSARRDAYVERRSRHMFARAAEEIFERENPAPKRSAYEKVR